MANRVGYAVEIAFIIIVVIVFRLLLILLSSWISESRLTPCFASKGCVFHILGLGLHFRGMIRVVKMFILKEKECRRCTECASIVLEAKGRAHMTPHIFLHSFFFLFLCSLVVFGRACLQSFQTFAHHNSF
jgi:hypothetical protein